MNWKPTNEFRWLKQSFMEALNRAAIKAELNTDARLVLQQKWVREFIYKDENIERETPHEEWRDIPTVTEESK